MTGRVAGVAAMAAAMALSSAAPAQVIREGYQRPPPREGLDILNAHIREGLSLEQYMARVTDPLRRADRRGDGLDAADLLRIERQAKAGARANAFDSLLRYDLNADLIVTPEEIRSSLGETDPKGVLRYNERYDVNGDGDIEIKEIVAAVARQRSEDPVLVQAHTLMALPPAQDGRLTAAELSALARETFAEADRDGSGVLSGQEAQAFNTAHPFRPPIQAPEVTCFLPMLSGGDQLILLGAYEGGGPREEKPNSQARRVTLTIEPGRRPLYVVATSYSPIHWRLQGEVTRVARFVALTVRPEANETRSVVSGPAPERVQLRRTHDCVPHFNDPASDSAIRAADALRVAVGRTPDVVFGSYAPREVLLPSGRPPLAR